ncbi:MAG: Uma2 family endonuclease [Caldilineaceae bacterium]
MTTKLSPVLEQAKETSLNHHQVEDAEPVWEIATLFPAQGDWSEEDYLTLDTNHFVEFSDGYIEVLPMPTESHQDIVLLLCELLKQFVKSRNLGKVLLAPLRIQLWPGKYREPDVVFMFKANQDRRGEQFWRGADLVMEVVSPDKQSRERDWVKKKQDYAQAGIPEYWIVDPSLQTITVLYLEEEVYTMHGESRMGEQATSHLLPGFAVDVASVFAVQE